MQRDEDIYQSARHAKGLITETRIKERHCGFSHGDAL